MKTTNLSKLVKQLKFKHVGFNLIKEESCALVEAHTRTIFVEYGNSIVKHKLNLPDLLFVRWPIAEYNYHYVFAVKKNGLLSYPPFPNMQRDGQICMNYDNVTNLQTLIKQFFATSFNEAGIISIENQIDSNQSDYISRFFRKWEKTGKVTLVTLDRNFYA